MDIHSQQNNQNIIINGYKLIKEINSGNYGEVMLMEKEGIQYAVKKFKKIPKPGSSIENSLKRESTLPLDLDHDNLIHYYGSFIDKNNFPYLVLEYYEGKNLEKIIEENKKNHKYMEQNLIITIFKQCLSALCYLQERKISHRDIKPSNIMINENKKIKIVDYGFIVYLNDSNGLLSGGKTRIGNRKYMCPEVLYREVDKYDIKGDIYSLGYTIFELMNLYVPTYLDDNNLVRLNSINYNSNNRYDQRLVELVEQMYKYYSEDRPTAREAFEKLLTIEQKINNNYIIKNPDLNLKEIESAMKCVLHFFIQMENILNILDKEIKRFEIQLNSKFINDKQGLNNNIITNLFLYKFYFVLIRVLRWKKKEISDKDYDESIKDFIITVNNRQNNKIDGPLPLKIFYNILFIINRDYYYNDKSNPIFLSPQFTGLLSDVNKQPTINKLNELSYKYRTPFLDYLYFLLIPLTNCFECDFVFKISEPEIKFYLSLDNKLTENIITDLVYNIFKPEKLNSSCNCIDHKGNYVGQKFIFSNLPKYLVFEIKNQNEPITLSKVLNMNSYITSNGKKNFYELFSIIYKEQDNYTVLYKNKDNWEMYNKNLIINYSQVSNIYNSVSLAIYKIKSI